MKTRRVALLGGGDWTDASVDHLDIPDDWDLDDLLIEYDCLETYRTKEWKYIHFKDFLLGKGAKENEDIEIYHLESPFLVQVHED